MVRAIWRFFGGINLTIWLLLGIAANLAVGSRYAKHFPKVYGELNFLRFQEWLTGNDFPSSWWVWLLFLLLALFGINTAVCTADRMFYLFSKRREYRLFPFLTAVSPSVMHLCFLVIIGGHAISQFAADIQRVKVAPGAKASVSEGTITVNDSSCTFRTEPGLTGMPKQCSAKLTLSSPYATTTRSIELLAPITWKGNSLYLTMASKRVTGGTPGLVLVIKKDPGLLMILAGNALLCMLMLWYFPIILRNRNGG